MIFKQFTSSNMKNYPNNNSLDIENSRGKSMKSKVIDSKGKLVG